MALLILGLLSNAMDPAWIFLIICSICFLPGVNLMNQQKLSKLNFGIVFFVAGTMAIGTVAQSSGTGDLIANALLPYLTGSELYTLLASWAFGMGMNFVLTPLAATGSFSGTIAQMAADSGYSPIPVMYAFLQGLDQYLFPYEYAILMYIYGFGFISMKGMLKILSARIVLNGLFIAVVAYPFWKLLGLF